MELNWIEPINFKAYKQSSIPLVSNHESEEKCHEKINIGLLVYRILYTVIFM